MLSHMMLSTSSGSFVRMAPKPTQEAFAVGLSVIHGPEGGCSLESLVIQVWVGWNRPQVLMKHPALKLLRSGG